jgi:NitT/TauT family transport system substrate-binding protein
MSMFRRLTIAVAAAAAFAGSAPAQTLDEVSFGTNWLAQAEHGGFYQAVADGTYEKHGLKVTIVQGGPNAANQTLLMADKIQFYMSGNLILPFSAVEQEIPVIEVAGIFQKDPQIFMTHPDAPVEKVRGSREAADHLHGQRGLRIHIRVDEVGVPRLPG